LILSAVKVIALLCYRLAHFRQLRVEFCTGARLVWLRLPDDVPQSFFRNE
jgi:hypothetical protein